MKVGIQMEMGMPIRLFYKKKKEKNAAPSRTHRTAPHRTHTNAPSRSQSPSPILASPIWLFPFCKKKKRKESPTRIQIRRATPWLLLSLLWSWGPRPPGGTPPSARSPPPRPELLAGAGCLGSASAPSSSISRSALSCASSAAICSPSGPCSPASNDA